MKTSVARAPRLLFVLACVLLSGCPGGAPVSITAKDLVEQYAKDKQGTDSKYKGKTLEITGVVTDVRCLSGNTVMPRIKIEGAGAEQELTCLTLDKAPWRKVTPGQTVKIRADWDKKQVSDDPTHVRMKLPEVTIVDVSGPPVPTISATELAHQVAADCVGTDKKYRKKALFLTGEIAATPNGELLDRLVVLKTGTGLPTISCTIASGERGEALRNKLKAGEKVKLLVMDAARATPQNYSFNSALVVDPQ